MFYRGYSFKLITNPKLTSLEEKVLLSLACISDKNWWKEEDYLILFSSKELLQEQFNQLLVELIKFPPKKYGVRDVDNISLWSDIKYLHPIWLKEHPMNSIVERCIDKQQGEPHMGGQLSLYMQKLQEYLSYTKENLNSCLVSSNLEDRLVAKLIIEDNKNKEKSSANQSDSERS